MRSTPFDPDRELEREADGGRMPVPHAFDAAADVDVHQRNLPHWRQSGVWYFVTFRLADSLPQSALRELADDRQRWLRANGGKTPRRNALEFRRLFSERIEKYLAAGYGECWLRRGDAAGVVAGALRHFDGQRYALDEIVVMPNHVHVLVAPNDGIELSAVMHSWKSFTANRINKLVGRRGALWQEESYDHIVRDEEELLGYRRYIVENPNGAGLAAGDFLLGRGSNPWKTPAPEP